MPELLEEAPGSAFRRFAGAPRLVEVRDRDDDWTGMTRTLDRRRRQNRLNQRAYRKRKQATLARVDDVGPAVDNHDDTMGGTPCNRRQSTSTFTADGHLMIDHPRKRAVTYAFMQLAYLQYTLKTPKLDHLPSLIRVNAINALWENARTIGFPLQGLCRDDLISPFNAFGPKFLGGAPDENRCPVSLRPTALQREFPHHPWTDLIPASQLRDNVLEAIKSGNLDEDELCDDLMDISRSDIEDGPYLIIWGEPSDVYSWEVSVGFLKKWGWLLRGCPELIESTNRWRSKRGEMSLHVKV